MKYLIIGAISFMAICIYFIVKMSGFCIYCPTYRCFGSCFGDGCVCVTAPGEVGGNCYGVEYSKEFLARGYTVQ